MQMELNSKTYLDSKGTKILIDKIGGLAINVRGSLKYKGTSSNRENLIKDELTPEIGDLYYLTDEKTFLFCAEYKGGKRGEGGTPEWKYLSSNSTSSTWGGNNFE